MTKADDSTIEDGHAGHGIIDANNENNPEEFLCYSSHNLSYLMETLDSTNGHGHGGSNITSVFTDLYPDISKLLQSHKPNAATEAGGTSESPHSANNFTFCPTEWDNLVCWPETLEGQTVTLPCFGMLNGIFYDTSRNATRYCMEGGEWTKSDYSECRVINATVGPEVGNLAITTGVYFFGYCVSLSALVIAIIIFLAFKELRCLRNTIHTHLMITYVLADTLWIITSSTTFTGSNSSSGMGSTGDVSDNQTSGSSTTGSGGHGQSNQVPCITFILLHYFHLTNFFWMFVEGLYLYVLVVQTFVAENIKLRTYACIGWGLPLIVVIAWSIAKWITQSESADMQATDAEFSASPCLWLPVNTYDWIYKTPVIMVLAANILFLLQIMWVLITKLRSAMNPETQQSVKAAKALIVLMPLLGITYVLVLSGSKAPVYEYLRALLISTQGFLVALLYCFLNGEVRMAIRHRWNRLRMMGPVHNCCDLQRRRQMHHMRDWSPRSRTESIRYTCATQHNYRKRDSTVSEATTVTTINSGLGSTGSCGSGYGYTFRPPPATTRVTGAPSSATNLNQQSTNAGEGRLSKLTTNAVSKNSSSSSTSQDPPVDCQIENGNGTTERHVASINKY